MNVKTEFVGGLRKNDKKTTQAVEMGLGAKINKKIVQDIQNPGVEAGGN